MNLTLVKTGNLDQHVIAKLYISNNFKAFVLIDKAISQNLVDPYPLKLFLEKPVNNEYTHHSDRRIVRAHRGMIGFSTPQMTFHFEIFRGFRQCKSNALYPAYHAYEINRGKVNRKVIIQSKEAYIHIYLPLVKKLSSGKRIFLRYFNT